MIPAGHAQVPLGSQGTAVSLKRLFDSQYGLPSPVDDQNRIKDGLRSAIGESTLENHDASWQPSSEGVSIVLAVNAEASEYDQELLVALDSSPRAPLGRR
jgi:hypothetical protein